MEQAKANGKQGAIKKKKKNAYVKLSFFIIS